MIQGTKEWLAAICGNIFFVLVVACLVWIAVGWLFIVRGEHWQTTTTIPAIGVIAYLITPLAPAILGVGLLGLVCILLQGLLGLKESIELGYQQRRAKSA